MLNLDLLLNKGAAFREISAGEVIFNQGASANFYHQLISGRIRWSNVLDNGKEVLHRIIEPGESFGEYPLFDEGGYEASAIADVPSKIIRLRNDSFMELLHEHPELSFQFNKLFVERLRFGIFLVQCISMNSPECLLESLFHYFNEHGRYICKECNRLMLTRQQLANITGLRVETVIRTIKNMQKKEKLDVVMGKVFVPSDGL